MAKSEQLLITKSPHPDESFLGYILRLTELNDYETPSWILQLADIENYLKSRESFVFDNTLSLTPLARLTGVQENELRSLTYLPVEPLSSKYGNCFIFGSPVSRRLINLYPAKVCPGCLNEYGYIRKIWELTAITVCLRHQCLLLDRCPRCLQKIKWSRNQLNVCHCKYDLTSYSYNLINESELRVTRRIHGICNLDADILNSADRSFNPLDNLDLQHLLSALFFIASQYGNITYENGKVHVDTIGGFFASLMNNREIHALLYKALLVFDDWPNMFFSFLDWLRENNNDRKNFTGITKDFGAYREGLYRRFTSPSFDFIRMAFEEYIATRWDGGYLVLVKRVDEHQREKRKYVSKAEAQKLLNISNGRMESLIKTNQLEAIVRSRGQFSMTLISKQSLECLKTELEQLITKGQAIKLLQVPSIDLKSLVKCKLLTLHQHPAVADNPIRFCLREIQCLMAQLESKVLIKGYGRRERSSISLSQVSNSIGKKYWRVGNFVKSIFDGNINPCRVEKALGLGGVFFYEDDVLGLVDRRDKSSVSPRRQMLGDVSRKEAAMILSLSSPSVNSLISKGILARREAMVRDSLTKYVMRSDLDYFMSTYVLPAAIAKKLRTTSGCIIKLLAMEKIQPISGPSVDGTPVYIFKRSDVEPINLEVLLNSKRQTKRQRKRERKLVNVNEVSEILKISKNHVESLIRNGIITPSNVRPQIRRSEGERFFYRSTIENISVRLREYRGLVSAKIAARILSIAIKGLYAKYVLTGRLTVRLDEGRRRRQYFLRRDVEAQVVLDRRTIRSAEAAALLGVCLATIHRMTVSGSIKPISGPHVDGYAVNLFLRSDIEKLNKVWKCK